MKIHNDLLIVGAEIIPNYCEESPGTTFWIDVHILLYLGVGLNWIYQVLGLA